MYRAVPVPVLLAGAIILAPFSAAMAAPLPDAVADRPVVRVANEAAIEGPVSVDPGETVSINITGGVAGGRLEIWGPVAGPVGRTDSGSLLASGETAGGAVPVTAPDRPGSYELRYVAPSGATLARRELEVAAVPVTLSVPEQLAAGLDSRIVWRGPGGPRDMLRIVDPATGAVLSQAPAVGTPGARNETVLRAPERLGDYSLQYWSSSRRTVLRSLPVTVVRGSAWLRTPVQIHAGEEFTVEWRGPPSEDNAFQIVDPLTDTVLTSQRGGAAATLTAPTRTGKYRIRYVNAETGHVFSDLPLQVAPR